MRDVKKARKARHHPPPSPAKAETKVLERPIPRLHPDHPWNKDRYEQGSNSEAALANDGRDSELRKRTSKKPGIPGWGSDPDNQNEDQPGFNTLESDQT